MQAPLSCINICIEVLDVDNDRVKVKKKIEVDKKIKPCDSEKLETSYLQEIDVTQYNNIIKQMIEDYENNDYEDNKLSEERVTGATNELYYGVPGAGKSHTIKEKCDDDNLMQRVVFHPDYTYSDFVGQIMPSLGNRLDNRRLIVCCHLFIMEKYKVTSWYHGTRIKIPTIYWLRTIEYINLEDENFLI